MWDRPLPVGHVFNVPGWNHLNETKPNAQGNPHWRREVISLQVRQYHKHSLAGSLHLGGVLADANDGR
jgi:hypothetical protein